MTITAAELVCLREGITASWPDTVHITRATRTSDNAGGFTTSWATVATVAGKVQPDLTQPAEPVAGDRQSSVQRWWVRLPHGTDVTTRDRLVVGTRTFEVVGVIGGHSLELFRMTRCIELT